MYKEKGREREREKKINIVVNRKRTGAKPLPWVGCGHKGPDASVQATHTDFECTTHATEFQTLTYASLSLWFLASMASVPLYSLCFSQFGEPKSRSFSFVASDNLRLGSSPLGFGNLRKNPRIRGSVGRAASVVFRDLDADDFRHPLDKQVRLSPDVCPLILFVSRETLFLSEPVWVLS